MANSCFARSALAAALTLTRLTLLEAGAAQPMSTALAVGPDAGRPISLSLDGQPIALGAGGGFRVYDVTNKQRIDLANGALGKAGDHVAFDCVSGDLRLHAEYAPQGPYTLVTGEIENLSGGDRGVLLDYCVPVATKGAVFSDGPGPMLPLDDGAPRETNAFPIAALCAPGFGLALAIPPAEPRIFGIEAGPDGLTMRFYLGLSPETANFPNRASFAFIVYGADPAWGFRSALERYHGFFPECCAPRIKADGLWLKQVPNAVPRNVDQYGVAKVNLNRLTEDSFAPYQERGILTYAYSLVGVQNLSLTDLPSGSARRIAKRPEDHPRWSKPVSTSACQRSNGDYAIFPRTRAKSDGIEAPDEVAAAVADAEATPRKGPAAEPYALSFILNPNPELFNDRGGATAGSDELQKAREQFAKHPDLDMAFLDSLGGRWPAILNYRREHFRYARYPLTVDAQGRVALHNELSHYELVARLRELTRELGRQFFANGVYTFQCRPDETSGDAKHYRAETKLGRFFIAAALDGAGCESGVKLAADRARDLRALLGRKYYAVLNYDWTDAAKVENFLNTCLAYALFGTNMHKTGDEAHPYVGAPNGDARDKALLDWFVPLARRLHRAGWEPVTFARIEGEEVYGERFGSGGAIYFTAYNESDRPQECAIALELAPLGLKPGAFKVEELARNAPVKVDPAGRLTLTLPPRRTCVLAVTPQ